MNIQSINLINNKGYNFSFKQAKVKQTKEKSNVLDANFFEMIKALHIKAMLKPQSAYNDFIFSKGKVTNEQYKKVINDYPKILAKAKDEISNKLICGQIHTGPKFMAKLALCTKEYLDKKYDKNYRIISIGTSPAMLSETMENLGVEVLYIPITNLKKLPFYKSLDKYPNNLKIALEYLKRNGLKEEKEKPKMNVLLDFSYSGTTLSYMKNYIAQYNKISPLYIASESISKLAFRFLKDEKNNLDKFNCISFYSDLEGQYIERISNVPHFFADEKDIESNFADLETSVLSKHKTKAQIFKNFDEFSRPLARAYSLCVLDCIKNMQKKSETNSD